MPNGHGLDRTQICTILCVYIYICIIKDMCIYRYMCICLKHMKIRISMFVSIYIYIYIHVYVKLRLYIYKYSSISPSPFVKTAGDSSVHILYYVLYVYTCYSSLTLFCRVFSIVKRKQF